MSTFSVILMISLQISWTAESTAFSSSMNQCSVNDAVNGIPDSNYRVCTANQRDYCPCAENTGGYFCPEWSSLHCAGVNSLCGCHGFVGLNLTYECPEETQLYKYQDGEYRYLNGNSVNYGLLLPEHAGLYECRNSTNHTVYTQNLTVNEDIRMGSIDTTCSYFSSDRESMCCSTESIWTVSGGTKFFQFAVYSNPDDYLSVTVKQLSWLDEKETRNDVDLGFYIEQNNSNPLIWRVGYKNTPLMVTAQTPAVMFRVTAANANSSFSICNVAQFQFNGRSSENFKIEDTSLPKNASVAEGQEAVFNCSFSYNRIASFRVRFEFSMPVQVANETVFETCGQEFLFIGNLNNTIGNCSLPNSVKFERDSTSNNQVSGQTIFFLRILKVNSNLSGSIATCSLFYSDFTSAGINYLQLQWKREAYLKVLPPLQQTTDSSVGSVTVAPLIASGIVVLVILSLVVGTTFVIWKKRVRPVYTPRSDEVPLTSNSIHSSRSTLCGSEPNTPVTQTTRQLGAIELMESNGPQRNGVIVAGEYHRLADIFYPSTSSEPINSSHPTGLQLLRDSHRTLELYDLSKFDEFVVYISYTDAMSEWVRNELKPLVESWHSVLKVNIHEDSMIPGFSVSGERQRLIFEADKIIIIVSSDYSTSEWCVYELEHAIHQMPALCNGRVIPILTDQSNNLPGIISGVVCLNSTQDDFKTRLHQALLQKPKSMTQ